MMALLSLADASATYGIPQGTLRRWLATGKLTRYGRKPYLVDADELDSHRDRRALDNRASVSIRLIR